MIDVKRTKTDIPMMVSLEDIDHIIDGHEETLYYLDKQGSEYILMGVHWDHCNWGPYEIRSKQDYDDALEDLRNKVDSLKQFRSQYVNA